jgi:hypothetical protein
MEERLTRLEAQVEKLAGLMVEFVPEVRGMFGECAGQIKALAGIVERQAVIISENDGKLNAVIDMVQNLTSVVNGHERRLAKLEGLEP